MVARPTVGTVKGSLGGAPRIVLTEAWEFAEIQRFGHLDASPTS